MEIFNQRVEPARPRHPEKQSERLLLSEHRVAEDRRNEHNHNAQNVAAVQQHGRKSAHMQAVEEAHHQPNTIENAFYQGGSERHRYRQIARFREQETANEFARAQRKYFIREHADVDGLRGMRETNAFNRRQQQFPPPTLQQIYAQVARNREFHPVPAHVPDLAPDVLQARAIENPRHANEREQIRYDQDRP